MCKAPQGLLTGITSSTILTKDQVVCGGGVEKNIVKISRAANGVSVALKMGAFLLMTLLMESDSYDLGSKLAGVCELNLSFSKVVANFGSVSWTVVDVVVDKTTSSIIEVFLAEVVAGFVEEKTCHVVTEAWDVDGKVRPEGCFEVA